MVVIPIASALGTLFVLLHPMYARPSKPDEELAQRLQHEYTQTCAEAARAIAQADCLLLLTGAGFSADSGLAVYADVANVEAYKSRGLKYHDICQPHWLETEPELFWGFWGSCHNDYRRTQPHEGYGIVRRWRDARFGEASAVSAALAAEQGPLPGEARGAAYDVPRRAGAFFCFTSNVDAHSFDFFEPQEVRECHGNTELYQCAGPCHSGVWRAPGPEHGALTFHVDRETMRASPGTTLSAGPGDGDPAPTPEPGARATVGATHGQRRTRPLGKLPPQELPAVDAFPTDAFPRCPRCGGAARPAILMFGDCDWEEDEAQEERFSSWTRAVTVLAQRRADAATDGGQGAAQASDDALKVVLLEIGAGGNVTTVRGTSEQMARELGRTARVTLVRVNPELPLGDRVQECGVQVLSLMNTGLATLRTIDGLMPTAAGGSGRTTAAVAE